MLRDHREIDTQHKAENSLYFPCIHLCLHALAFHNLHVDIVRLNWETQLLKALSIIQKGKWRWWLWDFLPRKSSLLSMTQSMYGIQDMCVTYVYVCMYQFASRLLQLARVKIKSSRNNFGKLAKMAGVLCFLPLYLFAWWKILYWIKYQPGHQMLYNAVCPLYARQLWYHWCDVRV